MSDKTWPSEWSGQLLDLIAQYGKASFEAGNRWGDDPEANEEPNRRAVAAWKAICAMLAVTSPHEQERTP